MYRPIGTAAGDSELERLQHLLAFTNFLDNDVSCVGHWTFIKAVEHQLQYTPWHLQLIQNLLIKQLAT